MPRITKVKEPPPEKVYLQWLDPEDGYGEAWYVTWCPDKVDRTDPEYVRKDLYADLLEALEDAATAIMSIDKELFGRDLHTGHYYRDELMDYVDKAIAKAKGE